MKVFSQSRHPVHADVAARGGAVLIDLVLVTFAAALFIDTPVPYPAAWLALTFAWFAGLPLTRLQGTPGKWIARIKLCDRGGAPLSARKSLVRSSATFAWVGAALWIGPPVQVEWMLVYWIAVTAPWAAMGFAPRRESLFDLLSGSRVVRIKASPEAIAGLEPVTARPATRILGTLLLWGAVAVAAAIPMAAQRDLDHRVRIVYALTETKNLRLRVEEYRQKESRWPSAEALGVPAWTAFPAGGGYGLERDGAIRIRFDVKPELKGRGVLLTPGVGSDGKRIEWKCAPYAELNPAWVPASCRQGVLPPVAN